MSKLKEDLTACWEWLKNPSNRDEILVALVSALLLAIGAWLWKRGLPWLARSARRSLDNAGTVPAGLAQYQQRVQTRAHTIRHPWMKEGQSLKDILVPVSIERRGGAIEDLRAVMTNALSRIDGVSRMVITGKPGSGKSVALWTISEECWQVRPPNGVPRIPILFSFREFRIADSKLDRAIETALVQWGYDEAHAARPCSEFVNDLLEDGRLLVLIDALDELGQEHRTDAATRVVQQLSSERYRRTPTVISCRTAAWDSLKANFADLPGLEEIHLADFTTAAIRRFVHSWRFEPPKSAGELLTIIGKQPHVGELSKNPLLLTIVCFLYSQPKYRLPENRAQFYEICTRALLEEWDQAAGRQQTNRFDRPDKEGCLGALAFEHIDGTASDADIDRDAALLSFQTSMHARSLLPEHRMQLLDEIVERSGLLGELPPNGLRFPHKTFMEYFAARYALAKPPSPPLLERLEADPQRWREVLLLACGLDDSEARTGAILLQLLADGDLETALAIMVDARALSNEVGQKVMAAARAAPPTATILNSLGFIGANPLTTHAESARGILLNQLIGLRTGRFPTALSSDLLVAALRCPDERILRMVEDHASDFELERILPSLGDRLIPVATRIVADPTMPIDRRRSWVRAMQRSGALPALFSLVCARDLEDDARAAVELALAEMSTLPEWWQELDNLPEEPVLAATLPSWNASRVVYARWGWPFSMPATPQARAFLGYLCHRVALLIHKAVDAPARLAAMHPWVRVLCMGLLQERSSDWQRRLAYAPDDKLWPGSPNNDQTVRALRLTWTLSGSARGRAWAKRISTDTYLVATPAVLSLLVAPATLAWSISQFRSRTPNAPWAVGFCVLCVLALGFGAWVERKKEDLWASMVLSAFSLPIAPYVYSELLWQRAGTSRYREGSLPVLLLCAVAIGFLVVAIAPLPSWLAISWLLAPLGMAPVMLSRCPLGICFPGHTSFEMIRALDAARPALSGLPVAPKSSARGGAA